MPAEVGTASWVHGSAPWLQVWTREEKTSRLHHHKNKPHSLVFILLFTNWQLFPNHGRCYIKHILPLQNETKQ